LTDALEDRDLNAAARNRPSTDHPVWIEPYPRRVRAFLDGVAVVDSTRALLLLEARHLPVYYFPARDVRTELLEPSDTRTHCRTRAMPAAGRSGSASGLHEAPSGATRTPWPSAPTSRAI
jgi:hypothetical protein